jgi:hypothetical protein
VRRRRSVLEFSDKQEKKLLQPPTSLEIPRLNVAAAADATREVVERWLLDGLMY